MAARPLGFQRKSKFPEEIHAFLVIGFRKSTLLNLLALLEDQDEDSKVLFHSHSHCWIIHSSKNRKSKIRKLPLALLSGMVFIGHITALQNIEQNVFGRTFH